MKKIVWIGLVIVSVPLMAKEMPKEKTVQTAKKEVIREQPILSKNQENTFVKKEVKFKNQNYPRGNIATH